MSNEAIKGKRKARKLMVQALYQQIMSGHEPYEIEAQFHAMKDMSKVDTEYFHKILHGVVEQLETIQSAFEPYLDRPLNSLNPVELAMLRLGTFELMFCPEIPYRVVLDEAVTLTKLFGSQDGHRYVNGVLNNLAKKIRAIEIDD